MRSTRRLCPIVLAVTASVVSAQPAPTAFTYQGSLAANGAAVTQSLPMSFRLFDAPSGGAQIGSTIAVSSVGVTEGLFTQALDFGAVDAGNRALWLEVTVDGFLLTPRQAVSASPYSLQTRGIYVDDAGRVGIGTDEPGAAFHVSGDGVAIRADSPGDLNPTRVELKGGIPGPLGGIHSSLDFADGSGAVRFGIQHDNAFGTEYLTARTASFPNGLIRLNAEGFIGIGDLPSIARLHVVDRDIGVFNGGMLNETLALEDNDAILGIYSSNTGNFGSGLVFGESVGNGLVDKWGLYRTTSNTAPELRVSYGTDPNYSQNPTSVAFVPGGVRFADGTVQRWAGVVDSFGASTIGPVQITAVGVFPSPAVVTITAPGQSVLVTVFAEGSHGADGVSTIRYRLAHRPLGSTAVPSDATVTRQLTEDNTGSVNVFEGFTMQGTAVIDGLAPGTHEIGLLINQLGDAELPAFYRASDISAIVF